MRRAGGGRGRDLTPTATDSPRNIQDLTLQYSRPDTAIRHLNRAVRSPKAGMPIAIRGNA